MKIFVFLLALLAVSSAGVIGGHSSIGTYNTGDVGVQFLDGLTQEKVILSNTAITGDHVNLHASHFVPESHILYPSYQNVQLVTEPQLSQPVQIVKGIPSVKTYNVLQQHSTSPHSINFVPYLPQHHHVPVTEVKYLKFVEKTPTNVEEHGTVQFTKDYPSNSKVESTVKIIHEHADHLPIVKTVRVIEEPTEDNIRTLRVIHEDQDESNLKKVK